MGRKFHRNIEFTLEANHLENENEIAVFFSELIRNAKWILFERTHRLLLHNLRFSFPFPFSLLDSLLLFNFFFSVRLVQLNGFILCSQHYANKVCTEKKLTTTICRNITIAAFDLISCISTFLKRYLSAELVLLILKPSSFRHLTSICKP